MSNHIRSSILKSTKLPPICESSVSLEERDAILNNVKNNIILDKTQLEIIANKWSLEDRMNLIIVFNETMLILNNFIMEFSIHDNRNK